MAETEKGVRAITTYGLLDNLNVLRMAGLSVHYHDGAIHIRAAAWRICIGPRPRPHEDLADVSVRVDRRHPGVNDPVFEADHDRPARTI